MKHLEAIMQTRSYSNNKGRELRESTSQQTDLVCRWKGITPFIIYLQVCFYHLHSFARCIGPAEFWVQVNCTCPWLTLVGMWCKIHVNKQKKLSQFLLPTYWNGTCVLKCCCFCELCDWMKSCWMSLQRGLNECSDLQAVDWYFRASYLCFCLNAHPTYSLVSVYAATR